MVCCTDPMYRILHHPWHPTIVYQATVSAAGIATGGVQGMMARRIAIHVWWFYDAGGGLNVFWQQMVLGILITWC